MPLTLFVMHRRATTPGAPPFFEDHDWMLVGASALLVAPWAAVATVVRQKDTFARNQTLMFALERSELERQALDARLHLLRAQVAPHFLFNTLANVQALVDAGSPRAAAVLRSLTAYLRATVPLLNESGATVERELQLVRPYLELMQMRMPDRLEYSIDVDDSALHVRCPPTTLMTLVENAVRHGIDPSEEGGRIDVVVTRVRERCVVRVTDTGAGLHHSAHAAGSGLSTLRERLHLVFGDAAHLRLTPHDPRGTIAEIEMPAQTGAPDARSVRVGAEA
jgi:LytS/YehU family sensor histidine kinase